MSGTVQRHKFRGNKIITYQKEYFTDEANKKRFKRLGDGLKHIKWNMDKLSTLKKNFYDENEKVAGRSEKKVEKWRKSNEITVVGSGLPNPVTTFDEIEIPEYMKEAMMKQGFTLPSPIQSQGWPMALLGRDMIGISATGSGKTLAFLLPAVIHINAQPPLQPGDGPIALVLSPTRELAVQIKQECDKYCSGPTSFVRNTVVYGGVPKNSQQNDLMGGKEIVIATPGRLIDFLQMDNVTNLRRVSFLVLDEADRMLDMGFEPQLRDIVSQIRPDRQTLMWSATWPRSVQALAKDFLVNFYEVHVGDRDLHANEAIRQIIEVIDDHQKYERMISYITEYCKEATSKALIFVETKKACEVLTNSLFLVEKVLARAIHGDKSQQDRDLAIVEYKQNRIKVLVATDVASRGLDIKEVNLVINFDMPTNIEDYIHRIGRTGRAGAAGTAVSFLSESRGAATPKFCEDLIEVLKKAGQVVPQGLKDIVGYVDKVDELMQEEVTRSRGGGGGIDDEQQVLDAKEFVIEEVDEEEVGGDRLKHKKEKKHKKDKKKDKKRKRDEEAEDQEEDDA